MNIALCDDELAGIELLRHLVGDYGRKKGLALNIHGFQGGEGLLADLERGQCFGIIFLDIFMGSSNGVDVARKIREIDKKCSIIFVTNSRDHAIEGYGVRAMQYLLKPPGVDALEAALEQALEAQAESGLKTIHITTRQRDYSIPLSDILFAESDARLVTVHRREGEAVSFYERLDNFEGQCRDTRFLRCHKSYLVNLEHVHSIANNVITMETGQEIPVSINISRAKKQFASFTASKI